MFLASKFVSGPMILNAAFFCTVDRYTNLKKDREKDYNANILIADRLKEFILSIRARN